MRSWNRGQLPARLRDLPVDGRLPPSHGLHGPRPIGLDAVLPQPGQRGALRRGDTASVPKDAGEAGTAVSRSESGPAGKIVARFGAKDDDGDAKIKAITGHEMTHHFEAANE